MLSRLVSLLIAFCIILSLTISSGVIIAQDGANRQPITSANVNQLAELSSVSGGRGFEFSPNSQWLAVGWGNFRVFDLQQGLPLSEPTINTDYALSWIFSPDSNFLLTTTNEINSLFDLRTGSEIAGFTEIAKSMTGAGVAYEYSFSSDSTLLALLNNAERKLKLLHLDTGNLSDISSPNIPFTRVLFSPAGPFIALSPQACGPWNCDTLFIANTVTGEQSIQRTTVYVNDIAFSPDGSMIAFGNSLVELSGADTTKLPFGTMQVIDVKTGQTVFYVESDQAVVRPILFSPDGLHLIYSTVNWLENLPDLSSSAIHIVNMETLEKTVWEAKGIAKFLSPNSEMLYSEASFGVFEFPNNTTHYGEGIFVSDLETGQTVLEYTGWGGIPAAFSPDSALFAMFGIDKQDTISIYETESGNKVMSLSIAGVRQLGFSPDGTILAASYAQENEDTLILWGLP